MKHIMIDLETWGTHSGSVIRSIGAVLFNPYTTGDFGPEFYMNIDDESQLALGLTKDQNTVDWWAKQSAKAQDALLVDQCPVEEVVKAFADFYKKHPCVYVWSQGSNFDGILWEAVCKAVGTRVPWVFYNTRDTRTIYQAAKVNTKGIPREGEHHNALDDSKHQALCVQTGFKKIGWLDYD